MDIQKLIESLKDQPAWLDVLVITGILIALLIQAGFEFEVKGFRFRAGKSRGKKAPDDD